MKIYICDPEYSEWNESDVTEETTQEEFNKICYELFELNVCAPVGGSSWEDVEKVAQHYGLTVPEIHA
jgi:hypothetical protein